MPIASEMLASLHAVAQLHVDKAVAYIASDRFHQLHTTHREAFLAKVVDVTAALSRHTAAVFEVNGNVLRPHLEDLLERLGALDAACTAVEVPSNGYARHGAALRELGLLAAASRCLT